MIDTACACTKVRRAARTLTQLYDRAVAPSGLKITQFSLLRTLQRVGETHLSGLAAASGLERSTLGRNIRLLEKAGLVRLAGSGGTESGETGSGEARSGESATGDTRERRVQLTAKGVEAIDAAMPLWREAQERVAAGLGAFNYTALFSLLDQLSGIGQSSGIGAEPPEHRYRWADSPDA